jgi:hypothetical protein
MSAVGFRTRKHGTIRQIGTRFPVLEKKKLPPKIALKKPKDIIRFKGHTIANIEYTEPSLDKPGTISLNFDNVHLSSYIQLIDKLEQVGQWDRFKNTVYLDSTTPKPFIRSCAIHEILEAYFKKKLGLDEFGPGHTLSNAFEKAVFLKGGRTEADWKTYDKYVEFIHRIASAGGKRQDKSLERAFNLLSQRQRAIKWQDAGLQSIIRKQAQAREERAFGRDLKRILERKLKEE